MAIENRINREQKIVLYPVGDNTFEINDVNGEMIIDSKEDYFIYFKNVFFGEFGVIEGRYLGENPTTIIDNHVKHLCYSTEQGLWLNDKNQPYKKARMVAVHNKTNVIIIIEP